MLALVKFYAWDKRAVRISTLWCACVTAYVHIGFLPRQAAHCVYKVTVKEGLQSCQAVIDPLTHLSLTHTSNLEDCLKNLFKDLSGGVCMGMPIGTCDLLAKMGWECRGRRRVA